MIDESFEYVKRRINDPRLDWVRWSYCKEADDEHAESSRQYMHVLHYPGVICVAHAAHGLPRENLEGLFAHEFGHLLLEYDGRSQGERAADRVVRQRGLQVRYTDPELGCGKGIQYLANPCRSCGGWGAVDVVAVNPVAEVAAGSNTKKRRYGKKKRQFVKQARELFYCLWPGMSSRASCMFFAACMSAVYNRLGPGGMSIRAGSSYWPISDGEDDQPSHWGYTWDANRAEVSQRDEYLGEVHCWCELPGKGEIIDITPPYWPEAVVLAGYDWNAPEPPDFVWCPPEDMPDGVLYEKDTEATAFVYELIRSDDENFGAYHDWVVGKYGSCGIGGQK